MTRHLHTLAPLLPYLRQHRRPLLLGFACMLVQNWGYMQVPACLQRILDEITGPNRAGPILTDLLLAAGYTLVLCVSMYLMRNLIIGTSRKIEFLLRDRLYRRLLTLDYAFYQGSQTGDLMSRCTNDLNDVRTLLGPGLMYVPNSLSRVLLFLPILISLSATLMALVGALLLVLTILIVVTMPYLRPMYRHVQEALADINNRVWQVVSGITTVKLYALETVEEARFRTLNRGYVKRQMRLAVMRGFVWPFFIFILGLSQLAILLVGGGQVIEGRLTLGELLQFNVMVGYLSFPVMSLGWIMSLLQQGISAMERINHILDAPSEAGGGELDPEPAEIHLETCQLTFRYPGAQADTLRGVDLQIRPGSTVGITGTVGSGKSTLLKVLTGLLRPDRGMVRVNGRELLDLNPAALQRRMAIVPQDTFLFSRTLAENIDLASPVPDPARVAEAIRQAGLEPDVQAFPNGVNEVVGERGLTLSGGQKQRVALARALLRDAPLIVLDDALSSVDARTEGHILDSLRQLGGRRTLIIVSHRVSALRQADQILVMDRGRVVEQGRHPELVARDGLYARLAHLQRMEQALRGGTDVTS